MWDAPSFPHRESSIHSSLGPRRSKRYINIQTQAEINFFSHVIMTLKMPEAFQGRGGRESRKRASCAAGANSTKRAFGHVLLVLLFFCVYISTIKTSKPWCPRQRVAGAVTNSGPSVPKLGLIYQF